MKYYVYRISNYTGRKEYKKTKTLDIYVSEALKETCWKFTKRGAQGIVKKLEAWGGWHCTFGIEEAEEGATK